MDNQKDLPKPEQDLPLPEKELESGAQSSTPQEKPKKSKSKWILVILVLIAILLLVGAGGYFVLGRSSSSVADLTPAPEDEVVCTQEAMLCPDGETYVSREGPNCEFAQCPVYEPSDAEITPDEDELENTEDITEEPLPTETPVEITP